MMRYLGMPDKSQQDWVKQIASSSYLQGKIDYYNQGELIQELETRVANVLGKPSALFFSKGMVAQFCAFKSVEELEGKNSLVLHPLSHLAFDEADSYSELLNFKGVLLGEDEPFTLKELGSITEKPGIVSVELPLRRAGFLLPSWSELCEISEWCTENNVHRHMDGARLWESTNYYQKSEAEISDLFDSVYVSLYKGLGALGGAVLAGDSSFIKRCKTWRTRFGGDSYSLFPFVVTALEGLDKRLKKIPELVNRAKEIALLLKSFTQLTVPTPQTNGFIVKLDGDKDELNEKAEALTNAMGIKLFNSVTEFPNTQQLIIEMQVGANHEEVSDEEIFDYFTRLLNID